MPRQDLLALAADDLVTLSNRGIVKRAQAELEGGQFTFELQEDTAGNLDIRWSDEVQCVLPAGVALTNGRCSCPATSLCRHLVRSVLAYQLHHTSSAPAATAPLEPASPDAKADSKTDAVETIEPTAPETSKDAAPVEISAVPTVPSAATPQGVWNPGEITDEQLSALFDAKTLPRIRRQWEAGHVMELKREARPSAIIHTLGLKVRFLVPHDLRYTHCDCAEPRPCSHVPLAVWAFRLLESDKTGGLVSTRQTPLPVPTGLLDDMEAALLDFTSMGVAGLPSAFLDRLRRLETNCREEGLIWPGEILRDLIEQCEFYHSHDARFTPMRLVELVGELCIRIDAIRNETQTVPPLFVRGSALDRPAEVGTARLIGLGCGARIYRGTLGSGVELTSFLQDMDSGSIVAMRREFNDPSLNNQVNATTLPSKALPGAPPPPIRTLSELATMPLTKGITMAQLGSGRLLVKGAKKSAASFFTFGRTTAVSFNPQNFSWDTLRAPLLAENFTDLMAHLETMPPTALRPRRAGENLHVCAVSGVEDVRFLTAEQVVQAVLVDGQGHKALMQHPFTERGRAGVEAMLSELKANGSKLRFVAGWIHHAGPMLTVAPISLVFEHAAARILLQPWIAGYKRDGSGPEVTVEKSAGSNGTGKQNQEQDMALHTTLQEPRPGNGGFVAEPWQEYPTQVRQALSEIFLLGLQRIDNHTAQQWRHLHSRGAALGFVRFLDLLLPIVEGLEQKQQVRQWTWQPTAQSLLTLTVLSAMAVEEL